MASKRPTAPAGCFWKGNTLYGRTRVAGQLIRWSLETNDPKVAAARRKSGKDRLIAVKRGDAVHHLHDVIEEWSSDWLIPNKGSKTAKRYLCSIAQLAPLLEGKTLDVIDGKLIADMIKARRLAGATNATIKRDLVALSSVFNYAIDQGWREENPVLPRMKRVEEKHHPIVLPSEADIKLILTIATPMIRRLCQAALATGAREDELLSARRDQVDHSRRQLTLIGKGRKGVKRHRVIDLIPFGGYSVG
jgi:integrase/recombinase XerD